MKKYIPILFCLSHFLSFACFAGNEPHSIGARSNALGNASITLSDPFSVFNNQAALAYINEISIGLYSERRFLLKELSYNAAGIIFPTKSGVFGFSANYYGFDLYNEKKIGLAYSRLFTEKIAAGIQLDYLGTSISEYGNASAFTFEAGLMMKINDKISTGVHVFNPVRVNTGFADEKIPTTIRLGLSFMPGNKVLLAVETKKNIQDPAQLCLGLEYRVVDALHLRAGIETNPSVYSFGIGINIKQLKIDASTRYHALLGASPQISVSYLFARKK
ncbi:MAG: hypothetical protein H0V61_03250 [Chitinophagales bacterium]|nr:hypothetical protein [Chitinophagales bacterium]